MSRGKEGYGDSGGRSWSGCKEKDWEDGHYGWRRKGGMMVLG